MTGREKAKAVAEKLRGENKEKEEVAIVKQAEAKNALATISENSELMQMYKENAKVGSKNLGGSSPLLKVHTAGRSTANELAEGGEPNNGWFFHKSTGEQFETVECHILTISKGFRADGINRTNVFNQIMAGVITNDGATKPFLMYLTGTKLKRMWDFGKEASKYTRAKPVPIPMFALKVKLTTEKEKTDYGFAWVVNFDIIKDGKTPAVVTDPGEFQFLRDMVDSVEDSIASLISAKATEDMVDTEKVERDSQGNEIRDIEDIVVPDDEAGGTEKIPF